MASTVQTILRGHKYPRYNEGRIAYAKSLLRESAAKGITPYAEGIRPETWTTWDEFVMALKKQFADVDRGKTPHEPKSKIWYKEGEPSPTTGMSSD